MGKDEASDKDKSKNRGKVEIYKTILRVNL